MSEIANVASGEIVLSGTTFPTATQVANALATGTKFFVDSETGGGSELAARVANAETAADVFGESELTNMTDVLGTTFKMDVVGIRGSEFEGLGFFLIVECVDGNGEVKTVAVGATDPITKLLKLKELGALPRSLAFEKSTKPTKSGYYPVNLVDRAAGPKGDF